MAFFPGSFLIARPNLGDPNFRKTVVLLLQHDAGGACGLVLNRLARVEGLTVPVYLGGPCDAPGLFLLHGHADWLTDEEDEEAGSRELAPGVYLGSAATLERAKKAMPGQRLRVRVFSGYSGWGPGQLEQELVAGVWAVARSDATLVFETPLEELWDRLMPTALPQPSVN